MHHRVVLKKGKEHSLQVNHHPWIFSGAIDSISESLSAGDLAYVYSKEGVLLGQGYFHPGNSLAGRMLSLDDRPIEQVLKTKIERAFSLRKALFDQHQTNCFRCINAEEDGLPGLVADLYLDHLVVQIGTLGMEKLKALFLPLLQTIIQPVSIYEKSLSSSRLQEGLLPFEGLLLGAKPSSVVVLEEKIPFSVSIIGGQKTGFFLDQREMRKKIGQLAKGKNVLNCFAYSGGFSLHALHGGAKKVISVDICPRASELCRKNSEELNGFSSSIHSIIQEDVFSFLEREDLSSYDLIILDPPAFAKKRQDIDSAAKGYRKLNQAVMERCKKGTILLTCSCSYFMDTGLFKQILFQAASAAGRESVSILSNHIQALDHPVSLYHPEGDYLKSFILLID